MFLNIKLFLIAWWSYSRTLGNYAENFLMNYKLLFAAYTFSPIRFARTYGLNYQEACTTTWICSNPLILSPNNTRSLQSSKIGSEPYSQEWGTLALRVPQCVLSLSGRCWKCVGLPSSLSHLRPQCHVFLKCQIPKSDISDLPKL